MSTVFKLLLYIYPTIQTIHPLLLCNYLDFSAHLLTSFTSISIAKLFFLQLILGVVYCAVSGESLLIIVTVNSLQISITASYDSIWIDFFSKHKYVDIFL